MKFLYTNLRRRILCLPQDAGCNHTASNISSRLSATDRVSEQLTAIFAARLANLPDQMAIGAQKAMGVVVEFGVDTGVDAFSAYSDGWMGWYDSAQKNYLEGKAANAAIAGVSELMNAAEEISKNRSNAIDDEPPSPSAGGCTISVITSSGIFFGTGSSRAMATDQLGAPVIRAALGLRLMLLQGR